MSAPPVEAMVWKGLGSMSIATGLYLAIGVVGPPGGEWGSYELFALMVSCFWQGYMAFLISRYARWDHPTPQSGNG